MSTYLRSTVPFVPDSGGGTSAHALDNRAIHTGQLSERFIDFNAVSGHNHNGVNSTRVNHNDLTNIGENTHPAIDAHINKPLAVPQTESSAAVVNAVYYRIVSNTPVFVGRAGSTAASVIALIGEDVVIGASGNQITVIGITSDQAGTISVVGSGYFAHPYIQFSEAIPNVSIRIRYGIEMTLDTLPESVLINEPLWIGETDQNVRGLVAEIKGGGFDRVIGSQQNLQGLDSRLGGVETSIGGINQGLSTVTSLANDLDGRLDDVETLLDNTTSLAGTLNNKVSYLEHDMYGANKQFGIAPEFPNMVFDNYGLASCNGTWLGGFESVGSVFHTYLSWSTNLSSEQRYRIKLAVKLPSDFGSWNACPFRIWRKSEGVLASVAMNVTLNDCANTATNIEQTDVANSIAGTWEQFVAPLITLNTYNFVANGWCCLTIEVMAKDVASMIKIGRIDFNYVTPQLPG